MKKFNFFAVLCFCSLLLISCSRNIQTEPSGVEDIVPGQKSVIAAPDNSVKYEKGIEEKNI